MPEIVVLLGKIYPLYILITLGFLLGRRWRAGRKQLAFFIIYIIGPAVIFHGAATAPKSNNVFEVPILFYCLCLLLSYISHRIGKLIWQSGDKSGVLAFVGGTANMGSFGIPLVLAFFGEAAVSVAIYSAMANIVFENTVGYYILVKQRTSHLLAIKKMLKLPAVYAFALGVLVNTSHYHFPPDMSPVFNGIRLLYICTGMLLIGLSLADIKKSKLDAAFTGAVFSIKFLIFPLVMMSVLAVDSTFIHLFDRNTQQVLLLLSVMPSGSNIIAFATKLNKHPELVGFTVLTTTLFALLYIPVFAAIFL